MARTQLVGVASMRVPIVIRPDAWHVNVSSRRPAVCYLDPDEVRISKEGLRLFRQSQRRL